MQHRSSSQNKRERAPSPRLGRVVILRIRDVRLLQRQERDAITLTAEVLSGSWTSKHSSDAGATYRQAFIVIFERNKSGVVVETAPGRYELRPLWLANGQRIDARSVVPWRDRERIGELAHQIVRQDRLSEQERAARQRLS